MNGPLPRPSRGEGPGGIVRSMLELVVVTIFVAGFVVQPYRIPSESMVPTLRVGDFLLVDKQSYAPAGLLDRLMPPASVRRGDLVLFHFPPDPGIDLVKRVVGVPGDRIRLRGGQVLVNGVPLAEPYAYYAPSRPNGFRDGFPSLREVDPNVDPGWWATLRRNVRDGEVTVPADVYFVLGDNRNDSEDSRYWGFVPRAAMEGRPLVVYLSVAADAAGQPDAPLGRRLREVLGSGRILR